MANNNFISICPSGCTTTFLPQLELDQDCFPIDAIKKSQICGLYFFPTSAPDMAGWTEADITTYMTANLDNQGDETKGRFLVVEGGMGASEPTVIDLPKGKTKNVGRKFTIDGTIRNLSDLNYEFLRNLQAGCSDFKILFETVGCRLFGGVSMISIESYNADLILGAGKDDYESGTIQVVFNAATLPDRINNPLA